MNDVPIDRTMLTHLEEEIGGPDVLAELVSTFLQETPRLLDDLDRAAATRDAALIERLAHTLKSTSATFGAVRLSRLARETEDTARVDLGAALRLAARLRREFELVRRELNAPLP